MPRRRNGNGATVPTSGAYSLEQQRAIKQAKDHFVACEKEMIDLRDSMKDTTENLRDKEIRPATISALRKHAKVIAKGGEDKAKEQLTELHEVGLIIGNDLFAAAGVALGEQRAPERQDNVVPMQPGA